MIAQRVGTTALRRGTHAPMDDFEGEEAQQELADAQPS